MNINNPKIFDDKITSPPSSNLLPNLLGIVSSPMLKKFQFPVQAPTPPPS